MLVRTARAERASAEVVALRESLQIAHARVAEAHAESAAAAASAASAQAQMDDLTAQRNAAVCMCMEWEGACNAHSVYRCRRRRH